MKKVYLYPLTARTKNAVINPYIGNLRDALNENFEVVNASKPSSVGIFDIIRYLGKLDVVYLNWSEEVPSLHRGRLQGIFMLILLPWLKMKSIMIVWTLHNKKTHSDHRGWLKARLYEQMMKKSDLIITHAREGLKLIPEGKMASFQHHPVSKPVAIPMRNKGFKFDIIIWGTIAPYKGITNFLKFIEHNKSISKYRILLAGKVTNSELAEQLQDFEARHKNLLLMDGYVEQEQLIQLIQESKISLFTYHSDSVLSSGALMDSLACGASIVGPAVGAFNDLRDLGLIETYADLQALNDVIDDLLASSDKHPARQKDISEFIAANTWDNFSLSIRNLIEQNRRN